MSNKLRAIIYLVFVSSFGLVLYFGYWQSDDSYGPSNSVASYASYEERGYESAQGWSAADQEDWYELSQGSRLVPLEWFLALLDSTNGTVFSDPNNMSRFGYIYWSADDPLPIGFVTDPNKDDNGVDWLGFNCAACHTSVLYPDKAKKDAQNVFIHGGQSIADFRLFLVALDRAVKTVVLDENERTAFSERLAKNATTGGFESAFADDEFLLADLKSWIDHRQQVEIILDGTEDWGPGRADAVAYIQRAAALIVHRDGRKDRDESEPDPLITKANAPVNYPFIWNANQQGKLQYNGLVDNGTDLGLFVNAKIGAFARNWTEAMGVFSDVKLGADREISSSIIGENLLAFERVLAKLESPVWPEIFGEINLDLAAEGAQIYQENCVVCHAVIEPDDIGSTIPFKVRRPKTVSDAQEPFLLLRKIVDGTVLLSARGKVSPSVTLIGTDPMMACNAMKHVSLAGILEGVKKTDLEFFGEPEFFGRVDFTTNLIKELLLKDLSRQSGGLLRAQIRAEAISLKGIMKTWAFDEDGNPNSASTYSTDETGMLMNHQIAASECAEAAVFAYRLNRKAYPLPGYKARPLNGIWASPPYLHNGSVPSIFALLNAPKDRPKCFRVKDGEYDVKNIGLAQGSDHDGFLFRVFDEDTDENGECEGKGQDILGNWNGGHDFGTGLTEARKYALIEYLKGL